MKSFLSELGDLMLSGLILFGSFLLIAAIFGAILYSIFGDHNIFGLRIIGFLLLIFLLWITFKA
jgi:hypothetical protein